MFADWKAPYYVESGVTENGFRRSLLSCTSSLIELLGQCTKLAAVTNHRAFSNPASSAVPIVLTWTDDQMKNLALLLIKGGSFPNVEISVPSVLAMDALGQRDFALRDACGVAAGSGAAGAGAVGLVSPVLNGLLTNALLRRLQDPNAYACDTTQQDKQLRLLEGGMQLMDSCFNALIDLHTSDEPTFLANYAKLQCDNRLQERGSFFANQLNAAQSKLDSNDLEKFSETLANMENFIQYKADFLKIM